MDIVIKILLFLHFFGLVIGMGSGVAMSRMGPLAQNANDDQRSILFTAGKMLSQNGHIGLGLLWVTGLLMVWLKYGSVDGMSVYFWIKMILVVILSASIGMASAAYKRVRGGDLSAMPRVKMFGMINGLAGLGVILSAVFAFN
mgnify:CR=1 FL=1